MTLERKTDRAFRKLEGIVNGILVDSIIEDSEIRQLEMWCSDYRDLCEAHPFNQIVPYINRILAEGRISSEEMETLQWFIGQLYQDSVREDAGLAAGNTDSVAGRAVAEAAREAAVDRLTGLLCGIMADGSINAAELATLRECMQKNGASENCSRFGELFRTVETIPENREPTPDEQVQLKKIITTLVGPC
jgi:hypothetical protein